MVSIDIRHTVGDLAARYSLLHKERNAATVRALNRTITTVRKQAASNMSVEYPGLKIGTIKAQMKMKFATGAMPIAVLVFSGKRFRLYGNFRMRAVGKFGVAFSALPWRVETGDGEVISPRMLASAFRQRSKATRVANVWIRTGRGRYPIEVLVAPSLASTFVERRIEESLKRLARERFAVVFQQEASYRLSKRL